MNVEADCLLRWNPVLHPNECNIEDCLCTVNLLTIENITDDQKKLFKNNNIDRVRIHHKKIRNKSRTHLLASLGEKFIKKTHLQYGYVGMKDLINVIHLIIISKT